MPLRRRGGEGGGAHRHHHTLPITLFSIFICTLYTQKDFIYKSILFVSHATVQASSPCKYIRENREWQKRRVSLKKKKGKKLEFRVGKRIECVFTPSKAVFIIKVLLAS